MIIVNVIPARQRLLATLHCTAFLAFLCWVLPTHASSQYPSNYSEEGPGIPLAYLKKCPVTKGFDFPVGKPNALGYYNAQKFTRNNHLGDDWNGRGGGNTDLNDPIYAIADGVVTHARKEGLNWGLVIRIVHNRGPGKNPQYVESVYAHLLKMLVKPGQVVKRGQLIARMGNAFGVYYAHLHLEIRNVINKPIGTGYDKNISGYVDPTRFILANRPKRLSAKQIAQREKRKKMRQQRRERKKRKHALIEVASHYAQGKNVFYDGRYRIIGFPWGDVLTSRGTAADVIVRVFRQIKIDLQNELHKDIKDHFAQYPNRWGNKTPDTNIDHRRVANLRVFFTRNGKSLKPLHNPSNYQPGDIVSWKLDNGMEHMGIVVKQKSSDHKRHLILHNIGLGPEVEDILFAYPITGHYRYYGPGDASMKSIAASKSSTSIKSIASSKSVHAKIQSKR